MNRPEPIELENNLGPDAVTGEINRVPWKAYDVDEMDLYIAEKDAEIAELKKKLMPCLNGDCILTCEVVEKYGKENAELKQKLDDAQAKVYADSIDAWKRERRLKRALWLKRADDASRIECMFRTLSDIEDDDTRTFWIFGNKWESVFYHLRCHRMKTAYDWTMIWENVECKCRAKAEEYK